uniref:FHA domain-containing protein n=1 Tax=Angiostrongylus costaricensis TaxID=334426 RepID=A0A0R3PEG1_ANGCS
LDLRKHDTFVVIGRLPNCDVVLDHPSISRYHCVLQYGDDTMDRTGKGWHIYDLGSTHGSKANKRKLPAKQYIRIRVGYVLQFGGSTRLLSLLGPSHDCEAEWNCSPNEMREKLHKKALDAKLSALAQKEMEHEEANEAEELTGRGSEGIDWGMNYGEDDVHTDEIEMDAHLMDDREQYYRADPKKALAKFFEREGFDMVFQISEQGVGHSHKWLCTIELPIEINGVDRAYTAQAIVSTSKKDAQVQCAFEACRILDAHGILRGTNSKARIRKNDMEANDFYDEDDDEYLDRTGQIEKQREKRMMWAKGNKRGDKIEKKSTYESLCKELEETRSNIVELKKKLDDLHAASISTNTGDSLDDYCRQLNEGHGLMTDMKVGRLYSVHDYARFCVRWLNKIDISLLRQKYVTLTHDAQRLEKLVKIAKPTALPEIKVAGAIAVSTYCLSLGTNKQAFLRKTMMVGRKMHADGTATNKSKEDEMNPAVEMASASVSFKPETDEDEEAEDVGRIELAVVHVDPTHCGAVSTKTAERKPASASEHGNYSSKEGVAQPGTSKSEKDNSHEVHSAGEGEGEGHHLERSKCSERESEEYNPPKKKRRARVRTNRPSLSSVDDYGTGVDDDRYATWLPPDDQTGDGKTVLNRKFEGRY